MKESKVFRERNLTEKVHYVYRVTIDEKYYIGKRSGFLNDLHTGAYKTSSKIIQEKLRNGHHFSKIKILQVLSSSKDALEFESRILTRVNAKANPKFLNQQNGSGDFSLRQHTEKAKKKMSKSQKTRFDINTEEGRKQRENTSEKSKARFDETTEQGRKLRENLSKIKIEFYNTEEGMKEREKRSQSGRTRYDENTEEGRKRRENASEKTKAQFDEKTELGRKRRENHSKVMKERFNSNTEEGRRNKEKQSRLAKVTSQKRTKTRVQNRKDASILGELMFDEAFIKENFLITDNKNNPRFLWSVYSKLSGYSYSHIVKEKREGKLSFLHGIESISISEELENSKIKEIEAIIKSRNDEKE